MQSFNFLYDGYIPLKDHWDVIQDRKPAGQKLVPNIQWRRDRGKKAFHLLFPIPQRPFEILFGFLVARERARCHVPFPFPDALIRGRYQRRTTTLVDFCLSIHLMMP